jgi:hypothetical protein
MSQVREKNVNTRKNEFDLFLEPHILLFRRSLKVSQQVQQQRAAAAIQAQQQQYNVLHMK